MNILDGTKAIGVWESAVVVGSSTSCREEVQYMNESSNKYWVMVKSQSGQIINIIILSATFTGCILLFSSLSVTSIHPAVII